MFCVLGTVLSSLLNIAVMSIVTDTTGYNDYKSILFKLLQVFTIVVCFLGFSLNSWAIFKQYFSGASVISSALIEPESGSLEAPVFVVCNKSGFKVPGEYFATNEEYDANTIKFKDVFVDIYSESRPGLGPRDGEAYNVTEMRTTHRGKCFVVTFNHKLAAMAIIKMKFDLDSELRFYVTEPGKEKFLVFEVWPFEIPYYDFIMPRMVLYDKAITKRVTTTGEDCHDGTHRDHYECAKRVFKSNLKDSAYPGNHCLTPWTSDFLGETLETPCSLEQAEAENNSLFHILINMSRGDLCKSKLILSFSILYHYFHLD